MVTKQEVMDYYAANRRNGICPEIVKDAIGHLGTDESGNIFNLTSFIDECDTKTPPTMEEVKKVVRDNIRQTVVDLIKISEI